VTEFFTARSGADERLYAKVQGDDRAVRAADAPAQRSARWPTRCGTSRWAARSCRAPRASATPAIPSAQAELSQALLASTCSTPPSRVRAATVEARLRACRPTWRQAAHGAAAQRRRRGRRAADAASRPATCRRCSTCATGALRETLYTGLRRRGPASSARPTLDNSALMTRAARAAPGEAAPARPSGVTPRPRSVAEDGALAGRRCWTSSATSPAAPAPQAARTSPSCSAFARPRLGLADAASPGTAPYAGEQLKEARYAFS
jgi:hypothetical protein